MKRMVTGVVLAAVLCGPVVAEDVEQTSVILRVAGPTADEWITLPVLEALVNSEPILGQTWRTHLREPLNFHEDNDAPIHQLKLAPVGPANASSADRANPYGGGGFGRGGNPYAPPRGRQADAEPGVRLGAGRLYQLNVTYTQNIPSDVSRSFVGALVDRLNAALESMVEQERTQLQALLEQRQAHLGEIEAHLARVDEAEQKLLTGELPVAASSAELRERIQHLQREVERFEIELMNLNQRRGALEEAIAEQSELMEHRLAENPVLEQAERIVEMRREALAETRELVSTGRASRGELREGEEQMAEAQVAVAELQAELFADAGQEELHELRQMMRHTALEQQEVAGRLEAYREQLEALRRPQVFAAVNRHEREVEILKPIIREEYADAVRALRAVQRQLRSLTAPRVQVVGGLEE